MDEVLSHLDVFSMQNIKNILLKMKNNRIVILVEHSSHLDDVTDEIVELKEREKNVH